MHPTVTPGDSVRNWVAEREIAATLRGERPTPADPGAFAYSAVRHSVAALLVKCGIAERLPANEASRLLDEARRQAATIEFRDRAARLVLGAFHDAGIEALAMKGVHLGNTLYPESFLRARQDTDLLIRVTDRSATLRVLRDLGYERQAEQTGDAVLGQIMFDRPHGPGVPLDVHWRLARPHAAAALFDVDAIMSRSVAAPRLGEHARGPAPADALALACVHRAAHHAGHDLLLWLYDVHLLVAALDDSDVEGFSRMAVEQGMASLCGSMIQEAYDAFRHPRAASLARWLSARGGSETSALLIRPRHWWATLDMDLRAAPRWSDRMRLLAGHAFPPAAYMRSTFAPTSRAPLPWLYARRVVRAFSRRGR
jgi:hypothetical protein